MEVRAASRLLEGDVVGDDRELRGVVRADEGVQVRVVGGWIAADQRGLTVAGGEDARDGRRRDEQGAADGDDPGTSGHCRSPMLWDGCGHSRGPLVTGGRIDADGRDLTGIVQSIVRGSVRYG